MKPAVIDAYVTIPLDALSTKEQKALERAVSYVDAQGTFYTCMRPRLRYGAVQLPRGAWAHLPDHVRYRDKRACPNKPVLKLNSNFKLDAKLPDGREFDGQEDAVNSMLEQEQGIVVRPPGTGKTQIAVAFMARAGTRCLVLVHTEDVLNQWYDYLVDAGIPEESIGLIRGNTRRIRHITLAMVQTFYNDMLEEPERYREKFGAVICDEAHHAPAATWEVILNNLSAKYRFGLTASPTRADGHHPYIQLLIGPIIHMQKFRSAVPVKVVAVETDFKYNYRGAWDWGNCVRALVNNAERNDLIAKIADAESKAGHSILILSRRIDHLEAIAGRMSEPVEILTGRRNKADRKRILADFKSGKTRVVCATQLADEALDVPRLDRVMLVHPGKAEGRIIQQIGRALRAHPDKDDAIIYDFWDKRVRPLRRQFNQRRGHYNRLKIKVEGGGISRWLSKNVLRVVS